jgi:hypothetical protein
VKANEAGGPRGDGKTIKDGRLANRGARRFIPYRRPVFALRQF